MMARTRTTVSRLIFQYNLGKPATEIKYKMNDGMVVMASAAPIPHANLLHLASNK